MGHFWSLQQVREKLEEEFHGDEGVSQLQELDAELKDKVPNPTPTHLRARVCITNHHCLRHYHHHHLRAHTLIHMHTQTHVRMHAHAKATQTRALRTRARALKHVHTTGTHVHARTRSEHKYVAHDNTSVAHTKNESSAEDRERWLPRWDKGVEKQIHFNHFAQ